MNLMIKAPAGFFMPLFSFTAMLLFARLAMQDWQSRRLSRRELLLLLVLGGLRLLGENAAPDCLAGFAAGLLLFLIPYRLSRGKMGRGDVYLAAILGLWMGFCAFPEAVAAAMALAAGAALMRFGRTGLPIGTFLILGAAISQLMRALEKVLAG